MRRRDVVTLGLIWAAVLAGLAWALSTQMKWVQTNKPLPVRQPVTSEEADSNPAPASSTGVIGNVSDDTMAAMGKGLHRQTVKKADPKVTTGPKTQAPKSAN